jgi:hypothetical protein
MILEKILNALIKLREPDTEIDQIYTNNKAIYVYIAGIRYKIDYSALDARVDESDGQLLSGTPQAKLIQEQLNEAL